MKRGRVAIVCSCNEPGCPVDAFNAARVRADTVNVEWLRSLRELRDMVDASPVREVRRALAQLIPHRAAFRLLLAATLRRPVAPRATVLRRPARPSER